MRTDLMLDDKKMSELQKGKRASCQGSLLHLLQKSQLEATNQNMQAL